MLKISEEEFEIWRDNPVTQEVLRVVGELAEQAKERWLDDSWGRGVVDPVLLADLRARAEVCSDLAEFSFNDLGYEAEDEQRHQQEYPDSDTPMATREHSEQE